MVYTKGILGFTYYAAALSGPLEGADDEIIHYSLSDVVNISCLITCAGLDLSGCRIEQNVIAIVNSKRRVYRFKRDIMNFEKDFNIHVTVGEYNKTTLCHNSQNETFAYSFYGFGKSSLREIFFTCGLTKQNTETHINSLLHQNVIVRLIEDEG